MNKKKQKVTAEQSKANVIRYMVVDMLDNLSSGEAMNLDKFEKEVQEILVDDNKNWV